MIDELNAELDVYENDILKQDKYEAFIDRIGLGDAAPDTYRTIQIR